MTASYDGSNQLASWNGITASSDSRGNLTYDPTNAASYTWNERNQLASAAGTGSSSFGYDGLGRRVSRTSGGVTTQYLYDGLNVARELSTAGNAELLSGLGVDDWFGRTQSSATVAMLRDALGSTIGLVNAGGAIATSYGYEPFGATAASGAASSNSHRFTGREQDPTGLYYLRNRYYNPMLGRFLSPDPIGIAGGINLYAYTFDDPMNWVDPLGLSPGASGGSGPGPGGTWQPCRGGRCVSFGGAEDQRWSNQGVVPGANGDTLTGGIIFIQHNVLELPTPTATPTPLPNLDEEIDLLRGVAPDEPLLAVKEELLQMGYSREEVEDAIHRRSLKEYFDSFRTGGLRGPKPPGE
jgi:RHS repeat-associated protein